MLPSAPAAPFRKKAQACRVPSQDSLRIRKGLPLQRPGNNRLGANREELLMSKYIPSRALKTDPAQGQLFGERRTAIGVKAQSRPF